MMTFLFQQKLRFAKFSKNEMMFILSLLLIILIYGGSKGSIIDKSSIFVRHLLEEKSLDQQYLLSGDYLKSLQYFKEYFELNPSLSVLQDIIKALKLSGSNHIIWLEFLQIKHCNNIDICFHIALEFHYAGKYDVAISIYKDLLKKYSNSAELWFSLGVSYQYSGSFQEASYSYFQAITLDSSHTRSRLNYSALHQMHGAISDAIKSYEELFLHLEDNTPVTMNCQPSLYSEAKGNLGVAYLKDGSVKKVCANL
jgi:tetratricopeptide (TPR) repeat protein